MVPQGVTRLQVVAKGGSGGKPEWFDNSYLGKGGKVEATMAVTPGQTLYLYVGGAGKYLNNEGEAAGFNGGGEDDDGGGGAGGGGTDIRIGGTDLANRILVAGGGGGSSPNYTAGGQGGGLVGGDGGGGTEGGGGGSQVAGGAGGLGDFSYGGADGYPGTLGQGGAAGGTPNDSGGFPTGGGGGGYYGGGGGGTYSGSGGGGSSYTDPALCANVVHTQGDNIGDGVIEFTWMAYKTCQSNRLVAVKIKQTSNFRAKSENGGFFISQE